MRLTIEQKNKVERIKNEINKLSNEEKYHLANMMTFRDDEPYESDIWDSIETSQINEIDRGWEKFDLKIALDLGTVPVAVLGTGDMEIEEFEILN
jgi:archaellum component FlaC